MAALDVIIIGGGLAGSCLANGLLNKAKDLVNVAIYERDEQNSGRDGYQIRLGSYALNGFRACLTEQQYTDLLLCFGRSGGVVSSAPAIFDPNLNLLLDLSKFPTYQKSAPIGRARLRNFLQAPLLKQNVIHHGKTFVRYEVIQSGSSQESKIRAHFSDGSSADCHILISAEGSRSRINRQLGCNNILEPSQKENGGLLGKCHVPWSVLRNLPHALVEKGSIYTASRACTLFAAVYLPDNKISPEQNASYEPHGNLEEKGHYDEAQASLMVGFTWNGGLSAREVIKLDDPKGYMRQQMAEAKWHPDLMKLIDVLEPDALQAVTLRQSKDTPVDWRQRTRADKMHASNPDIAHPRVWLIGDSFHPMLPSRGMGANNAICDTADILGPLIELARQRKEHGEITDEEVRAQLAVYEKAMIPRSMSWVKKSAQQSLPDLESTQGRFIIFVVRILLAVVGTVTQVARMLGWEPKDDAPELP
ncbi:FAD/NAD(P)-binding domain-containing protein [Curvularia clavata]|uniref:FAD/NAD(P)-binding domain-containing protein n=1 Tax=Curvularia clavata TaxID=95742 RepID=A0A9Q9DQW6_CURCL|nr:FAD/NAD(P)-binding domain-containing protein [Curvularia clavata]